MRTEVVKFFTLNSAKWHKSATRPYPFLIAHECNDVFLNRETNQQEIRKREYYAFDSIDVFIRERINYPHAHEVIWDRLTPGKQQGRLVFDFDFTTFWYGINFVPNNFLSTIETLVCETFKRYYDGIDLSRLIFIWLISDVEKKWSKHLIVKNAHFCDDWKEQSLVFYNLFLALYEEVNPWPEEHNLKTKELIDIQVARGNATMRMMGSSKLGGKTLLFESAFSWREELVRTEHKDTITFYDTLIQLYRREDVTNEQNIRQCQLRKKILDEMFFTFDPKTNEDVPKMIPNKFYREACKHAMIDLTRFEKDDTVLEAAAVQKAFATFENHICREMKLSKQTIFRFKGCKGCLISLERVSPAPCLLSGKVHDNENAFLRVTADIVYFHCLRGCELGDKRSIRLFGTI
uniref:Uncharacterized protein n=1 Tax=viral metagenome TaxID=1070528 RepID=A0A6C0CH55_9ZZZZ